MRAPLMGPVYCRYLLVNSEKAIPSRHRSKLTLIDGDYKLVTNVGTVKILRVSAK